MKSIFDDKRRPSYTTMLVVVIFVWACDIASRFGFLSLGVRHGVQLFGFAMLGVAVAQTILFHVALRSFRSFLLGAMICGLGLLAIPVFLSHGSRQGLSYFLVERLLAYGWYSAPFFILIFYVRSFERMQGQLASIVQERTSKLTEANHQLQKEICEKMLISNELEYAKMDLEAALEKKTRELQDIEQQVLRRERLAALAHIASGVSHELNNTLSPIVSYSSMLLEKSILTDEQYDWVERISNAGESAIRVVNNLQQFHHKSTGTSFYSVSPGAVVEKVIESVQPACLSLNSSSPRTLAVESQIDSKKKVYADFSQLTQLLRNLVMNAVDSMPPDENGTVTISTRDETGAVVFEVRDDGRGMRTHEVERCFEPFFTTKHKRTGLGLSACYGIAKRHGGTIDVVSKPGEWTTFSVRIPHANELDVRSEHDVTPTEEATKPSVAPKPNMFDNISILLVEDDETVRVAMTDLLHSIGATVDSASNGRSAIELLRKSDSYDILITDLLMEGMDGVELLEKCRQLSGVPVIMMSGWPRRRVNERLEGKPKPDAILSKPCKFGDIISTLEEHAFKRKAVLGRS